jgi:hypothetical protein
VSPFRSLTPPQPNVCFRNERPLPSSASRNVNISPVLSALRILPVVTGVRPNPSTLRVAPSPLCLRGKPHILSSLPPSLSLFALFLALPSFVFNSLQPLLRKHRGWHTPSQCFFSSRRSVCAAVSSFRINTSESVSKQTTLTSFRINTYGKPRERGCYC